MFQRNLLTSIAAALVAGSMAFAAPAMATTVLIVDSNKIWNDTKAGKDVQRQLVAFRESLDTQLKEAGETLQKDVESLRKEKDDKKIEEAAFTEKARELAQREAQLRGGVQQRQTLVQVATRNAQAQFYEAIRPMLLEVMQEKKGDILMEKSAVLFSTDGIEVTQRAIAKVETGLKSLEVVLIPQSGEGGAEGEAQGPAPKKN